VFTITISTQFTQAFQDTSIEVIELRTEHSKYFKENGKLIQRIYDSPIHYQSIDGNYYEIDHSLKYQSNKYYTDNHLYNAYFSSDQFLVDITYQDYTIQVVDQTQSKVSTNIKNDMGRNGILSSSSQIQYQYDDNTMKELYLNRNHLLYQKSIRSSKDLDSVKYLLNVNGLDIKPLNGEIHFVNPNGDTIYTLSVGYLVNQSDYSVQAYIPTINQVDENVYELSYVTHTTEQSIRFEQSFYLFEFSLDMNFGSSWIEDKYILEDSSTVYSGGTSTHVSYNSQTVPPPLEYLVTVGVYSIDALEIYKEIYNEFYGMEDYTSIDSIKLVLTRSSMTVNPKVHAQWIQDETVSYDSFTGLTSVNQYETLTTLTGTSSTYSIPITKGIYYQSFEDREMLIRLYPDHNWSSMNGISFHATEATNQSNRPYVEVEFGDWYIPNTNPNINCYAFAIGYHQAINPGSISGNPIQALFPIEPMTTAILDDLSDLNYNVTVITNPLIQLQSNEFIIGFRGGNYDFSSNYSDFHVVYRGYNTDWYEKPGNTASRVLISASLDPSKVYWYYIQHDYNFDKYNSETIFIKITINN